MREPQFIDKPFSQCSISELCIVLVAQMSSKPGAVDRFDFVGVAKAYARILIAEKSNPT